MAGNQIKDQGTVKSVLDGTEYVPIQETAGGVGSTRHAPVLVVANLAAGAGPWTDLGNLGATAAPAGDGLSGVWTDLGNIGPTQTLTG